MRLRVFWTSVFWVGLTFSLFAKPATWAASVSSFEEIDFWTGQGENRAAIVIDWDSNSDDEESLVWGFRWTGVATGEQMLRSTLAADPRLYAKFGSAGSFGLPVYGLGYDLNNDSQFGISDSSVFEEQGITISGIPDPPPQVAVAISDDAEDAYAEGFYTGFWHYAIADGEPFAGGHWLSSAQGLSDRVLANGDWDSWAFENPPSLFSTAFAENPIAAVAPYSADFDADNDIDGSDFLAWQRGFSITSGASLEQGDANGDGEVDSLDLQLWALMFSNPFSNPAGNPAAASTVLVVPEPSSLTVVFVVLFLFLGTRFFDPCRTRRSCF